MEHVEHETSDDWSVITTEQRLTELVGPPIPRVAMKVRTVLHTHDRAWLAASPFVLLATAAADGRCDVSPKGDPPGLVHVLDDHTVVIPDRPGNRRVDGFRNVLSNPHAGLLALIPGRGDTLRINGRAAVATASFFDDLVINGKRPELALVLHIDEVFYHCSRAFLRSALWEPAGWQPDRAPRRAQIARDIERPGEDLAALEEYYGAAYGQALY